MEYSVVPVDQIEQGILALRGQKVILDRHLAALYGVETRVLNQAVKRNRDRFPGDFMFELTREEIRSLSQIVISSPVMKYAPKAYAFTEQGVAMLSSVLRSPRAVQVNIAIMRAFVRLRETLSLHKELAHKLADLERRIEDHDEGIHNLFEAIRQLTAPPPARPKRPIGFHIQEQPAVYRARKRRGRT